MFQFSKIGSILEKCFSVANISGPTWKSIHKVCGEIEDTFGGELWAEAPGVNVGNDVAVGVSVRSIGAVGHVGGKAVGSREAGALADQ